MPPRDLIDEIIRKNTLRQTIMVSITIITCIMIECFCDNKYAWFVVTPILLTINHIWLRRSRHEIMDQVDEDVARSIYELAETLEHHSIFKDCSIGNLLEQLERVKVDRIKQNKHE